MPFHGSKNQIQSSTFWHLFTLSPVMDGTPTGTRGILVKSVIYVSPGHLKFEIANFMSNVNFLCFLPFSIVLSLKNIMGNLIAPLTNFLQLFLDIPLSRRNTNKLTECFGLPNPCIHCFLPFSIVLSLKNVMGSLIAPLTNFLEFFFEIPLSH